MRLAQIIEFLGPIRTLSMEQALFICEGRFAMTAIKRDLRGLMRYMAPMLDVGHSIAQGCRILSFLMRLEGL